MAVPVRLLLAAVLALSAMGIVANSALMTRAGVKPGCSVVNDGNGGPELQACHAGWFKGSPNLVSKGCTAVGVATSVQYWSCPRS
jgi:hypothetical protein